MTYADQVGSNRRVFFCHCGCSALVVDYDKDLGDAFISPWAPVFYGSSLFRRLEQVWWLLKHGQPYADFTIHGPVAVRAFGRYLLAVADELEARE